MLYRRSASGETRRDLHRALHRHRLPRRRRPGSRDDGPRLPGAGPDRHREFVRSCRMINL